MAYKVTRRKGRIFDERNPTADGPHYFTDASAVFEWDVTIIKVVADSYSELIEGIDSIGEKELRWYSKNRPIIGSRGFEGRPNKSKGKWKVEFSTPIKGRGRKSSEEGPLGYIRGD